MNESLNTDNKDIVITDEGNLEDSNNDLKKQDNDLSGGVSRYNKILEQRKKRRSLSESLVAVICCILIFLFVLFDVYTIETQKYDLRLLKIQQDQAAREKQAEIDKIKLQIAQKNKESADLVIFNDKYLLIRKEYYSKVKAIAVKSENKFNSLEDIIKLTEERIKLSNDYKDKINTISIPVQMTDFIKFETEFIDSDISLWTSVNAYYLLDDLSKFDTSKIYEESSKSHQLFLNAQEEIKNAYTENGLSYFLKDIIISY